MTSRHSRTGELRGGGQPGPGYCSRYYAQLAISYVEGEVLEGADMTKRAKQVAAIAIN